MIISCRINRHSHCFFILPSVVVCLVTLINSTSSCEVLEYYLLYVVSLLCYCELSNNSFMHHCKTRLWQEAPCVITPKNFHGESLPTHVNGLSLLHVNCTSRRKIIIHGWPWQLPLQHIPSTRRPLANSIAKALRSSSPHGIQQHENENTISRLACQHAKSQYNNQGRKCYQLWTLQRFSKEWWQNLYLQPYQSRPRISQRKVCQHWIGILRCNHYLGISAHSFLSSGSSKSTTYILYCLYD